MKTSVFLLFLAVLAGLPAAATAQEVRIVDGQAASYKGRAAVGSLYHNKRAPANEGHFCAATLIGPRWALTAGHCLEYINRRGNTDIVFARRDLRFFGGVRRAVVRTYRYPGYNKKNSAWDVALLYLNRPIEKIRPLRLRFPKPKRGTRLTVLGWGQTKIAGDPVPLLQQGRVRVRGAKRCYSYINRQEAFCAAGPSDICYGDSGGPALDGHGRIRGLISRGGSCGNPDYPGVYSRLAFAKSWLKETLAKKPRPPFRAPRPEKRYNPLIIRPHADLGKAASGGWHTFSFSLYSREKIREASLLFQGNPSFCLLSSGDCGPGPWTLENIYDPNQETFVLDGRSKEKCLRFSWRLSFRDERIPGRQGSGRTCAFGG